MKFLALVDCPQGQQAGEIFEATEDAGHVLELVGAARRVNEQAEEPPAASEAPKTADEPESRRRQYRRRDLTAQD